MTADIVLETEGLNRSFGALRVTQDVSFKLPRGARFALIGPNGAGKSTFINLLTGALMPSSGRIRLHGEDITRVPSQDRVRRGLVRTFQINTLFPHLTPLEATVLAIAQRHGLCVNPFKRLSGCHAEIDEAHELLDKFTFGADGERPTHELAYGRQRLLEIVLALAAQPKVLLLDEPAAGVPQQESAEIFEALAALPDDIAVLFIEHDMDVVFRFAQRITVLVAGQILCEGTPEEIADHPQVREVYLGDGEDV
ncbi:MAG TPA: ABC transporter ATP-binding protein [Stellaceae bacterium]|jgi:ABC-type branched-subunit amino acid transport system ATPase component